MKRIWLATLLIFGMAGIAVGQTTTTSFTTADPDSVAWNAGTYSIQYQNATPGKPYNTSTGQFITTLYTGTLNSSGALSLTLDDVQYISPANGTWIFTICPDVSGGNSNCATTSIPVTGTSENVSSQINAVLRAPRPGGGVGAYGYADVEFQSIPGNTYVVSPALTVQRCYAGSWAACGGGGGGSLPTATTANEVPNSSGAGTTYTAQPIPNAFWASSSTPLYTFCHFRDDSSRLWISYSVDGENWIDTTASAQLLPSQLIRDPSCMYQPSTNTFYFVATTNTTTFYYFTWTNGVFSSIQNITVTGASTGTVAPEWFTDPVSGNIYVVVAYQTSGSGGNHVIGIGQFTLGSQTFGAFTQLTLSGAASAIDPFIVYTAANSTYNLFYANLAVANEQINVATSTSLTGTFTQQNGTNPLFAFLTGVTLNEGPTVFTLPNGCYRMLFDSSLGANPSNYFETQADNCNTSLLYSTWTTPVYVDIDRAEHGTVMEVTTNAGAQQIFALAQQKPDYANAGRLLIGGLATDTPWWPAFIKTLSNAGGLSSDQPAGVWMDSLASDAPPYTHAGGIYQDLSVAGQLDTTGNFNPFNLNITNTRTANNSPLTIIEPNLANGAQISTVIGTAFSSNNAVFMNYNQVSGFSSSNNLAFNFYGTGNLLTISPNGVTIPNLIAPVVVTPAAASASYKTTTTVASNTDGETGFLSVGYRNMEGWNNSTPGAAWNLGWGIPNGSSAGTNILFNAFGGSSWQTAWSINPSTLAMTFAGAVTAPSITPTELLGNAPYSNGTCTTAATLNPANGNYQTITLTAGDTCALTFTQPSSATFSLTLKVIQSSSSSYNGGISGGKWPGGIVPTITQTTGAVDFISCKLDGTNAYCVATQNFE